MLLCSVGTWDGEATPVGCLCFVFSLAGGAVTVAECNVINGRYRYGDDLAALAACNQSSESPLPVALAAVSSPVQVEQWVDGLASHPDRQFVQYICSGLSQGFRIGFQRGRPLRSARRNMGSANANSGVVDAYLDGEVRARRLVGPPPEDLVCHVSPFGVIPKPHQPGKWRLIVNLSAPEGASVNDGVSSALAGLQYARLEDAARLALQLEDGAVLAKLDLKAAYRMVPVHPADRPLLAVQWKGQVWLDAALPFGLRSAPKIFSAVADALLWVMREKGVTCGLHYLDDFLFLGRRGSEECAEN